MRKPDYKKIYTEMILRQFPEKMPSCEAVLRKANFSILDIIKVQDILFGHMDSLSERQNKRHRAYDVHTIVKILDDQKKNNLNNSQLALKYGISRNTLTKWKKLSFAVAEPRKK